MSVWCAKHKVSRNTLQVLDNTIRAHWPMLTSDFRWQRRLAVRYNVDSTTKYFQLSGYVIQLLKKIMTLDRRNNLDVSLASSTVG